MLYCMLRGLLGSSRSMVPNGDSKITDHINRSQCSNHLKVRMALFLCNLAVCLVPILYADVLGIARQNVEWTQMLLATCVKK